MTIKYGFFNSVNGDRKYNADDIGRYLHGLVSSGVYADETNSLQVVANGGLQIAVQPGRAMLDYHYMENDAPLVLELSAGGTMDRIDIVVARLDLSNRLCEIIVREGTPASAPTRPIIYKTDLAKEYLLASIHVTKLATSITQSDITDTRGDDTVCGWVRSIVGQGNAGIPVPAQSDADKVPVVKPDGSGYSLKNANELKMPGDMDMGGYRITTLGPPKNGTDAATADYVSNQIKTNVTNKKGAANGLASLDDSGRVPTSQLPAMNYIPTTAKGAANGVASLDATGKVPTGQMMAIDDQKIFGYADISVKTSSECEATVRNGIGYLYQIGNFYALNIKNGFADVTKGGSSILLSAPGLPQGVVWATGVYSSNLGRIIISIDNNGWYIRKADGSDFAAGDTVYFTGLYFGVLD